jgi:hypothetical protein
VQAQTINEKLEKYRDELDDCEKRLLEASQKIPYDPAEMGSISDEINGILYQLIVILSTM